jgi:uncharacterized protein
MAFNFIPKEEKFFELFENQAKHSVEAAKLFVTMLDSWTPQSPLVAKLHDIEHEADITTHEIIDKLNRTFVTPFDREDIHMLASELDDVTDLIYSVANRMSLYKIDKITEDIKTLAGILVDSTENMRKAVAELGNPAKSRRVLDHCIEINRLENAGDRALEKAIGKLFEGKPDPLEVIKWKEIYESLEYATDKCEDVANTLESILVKHS